MENENIQSKLIEAADSVFNSDLPKQLKLLRLWAIMMLDYRGPASEHAHEYFLQLVDKETSNFIFYLTGYLNSGFPSVDKLIELITGFKSDAHAQQILEEAIRKEEVRMASDLTK